MNLWNVAALVALINLPFGYWRANEEKFSRPWFLAVHIPVPFAIALRILSGIGWHLAAFPVMVGAFFIGQYAGGLLRRLAAKRFPAPATACLVMDVVTSLNQVRKSTIC